jgi:hypothetical protein
MERHLENFHSANSELEAFLRGAVKFPFVLLPPGKGRLRESIEKYIRLTSARPYSLTNDSYDYERLSRIEALGEAACYVGVKLWKGYVAFDFPTTDKVVLECPRTGNATFVLTGDWRKMISLTKAELRTEYGHQTTRIIHTSNWEVLIRRAVFGSDAQRPRVAYVPPRTR